MPYQIVNDCKTPDEAIAASKYFIGQRAKVVKLAASGNMNGEWVVIPEFEVVQDKGRHRLMEAQGIRE